MPRKPASTAAANGIPTHIHSGGGRLLVQDAGQRDNEKKFIMKEVVAAMSTHHTSMHTLLLWKLLLSSNHAHLPPFCPTADLVVLGYTLWCDDNVAWPVNLREEGQTLKYSLFHQRVVVDSLCISAPGSLALPQLWERK